MGKTLRELTDTFPLKQPQQVENLVEEAPILNVIPFQEASHGLWNMYEDVTEVTGAGWVNMNSPLPIADMTTQLRKVDLSVLGAEVEVPEDTARMLGGRDKYFSRKMPKVLRRAGMATEQHIIYDNFRGWALDNNKAINAGATNDGTYSILAVRFSEGETCGLYSSECVKQGSLIDINNICGGNLYKAATGPYAGVLVYGLRIKAYLGMQIGNPLSVSVLVNIDEKHAPTDTMIDDLLTSVRATTNGNTYLFMHERARNILYKHEGKGLKLDPTSGDIEHQTAHWSGVQIVTSYNFLDGTESVVDL